MDEELKIRSVPIALTQCLADPQSSLVISFEIARFLDLWDLAHLCVASPGFSDFQKMLGYSKHNRHFGFRCLFACMHCAQLRVASAPAAQQTFPALFCKPESLEKQFINDFKPWFPGFNHSDNNGFHPFKLTRRLFRHIPRETLVSAAFAAGNHDLVQYLYTERANELVDVKSPVPLYAMRPFVTQHMFQHFLFSANGAILPQFVELARREYQRRPLINSEKGHLGAQPDCTQCHLNDAIVTGLREAVLACGDATILRWFLQLHAHRLQHHRERKHLFFGPQLEQLSTWTDRDAAEMTRSVLLGPRRMLTDGWQMVTEPSPRAATIAKRLQVLMSFDLCNFEFVHADTNNECVFISALQSNPKLLPLFLSKEMNDLGLDNHLSEAGMRRALAQAAVEGRNPALLRELEKAFPRKERPDGHGFYAGFVIGQRVLRKFAVDSVNTLYHGLSAADLRAVVSWLLRHDLEAPDFALMIKRAEQDLRDRLNAEAETKAIEASLRQMEAERQAAETKAKEEAERNLIAELKESHTETERALQKMKKQLKEKNQELKDVKMALENKTELLRSVAKMVGGKPPQRKAAPKRKHNKEMKDFIVDTDEDEDSEKTNSDSEEVDASPSNPKSTHPMKTRKRPPPKRRKFEDEDE